MTDRVTAMALRHRDMASGSTPLSPTLKTILYICSMKKEFGKWLMDIAKYLTTAVLLSSVFNDIKESWVIYLVVSIAIVLTLLTGLLLVKDKKEEKEV